MERVVAFIGFLTVTYFVFGSKGRRATQRKRDQPKGIKIVDNFLPTELFNKLVRYTSTLDPQRDKRSKHRLVSILDPKDDRVVYDALYSNEKLKKAMQTFNNGSYTVRKGNPSFPVEYRIYPTKSKGMPWHKDTSLFSPNAIECVLTLTNNSDSKFMYTQNRKDISISPNPNQLIMVAPNSVEHKVTPVSHGERSILKFVVEFLLDGKNKKTKEFYNEYDEMYS